MRLLNCNFLFTNDQNNYNRDNAYLILFIVFRKNVEIEEHIKYYL